jgi:hypothetical protein
VRDIPPDTRRAAGGDREGPSEDNRPASYWVREEGEVEMEVAMGFLPAREALAPGRKAPSTNREAGRPTR